MAVIIRRCPTSALPWDVGFVGSPTVISFFARAITASSTKRGKSLPARRPDHSTATKSGSKASSCSSRQANHGHAYWKLVRRSIGLAASLGSHLQAQNPQGQLVVYPRQRDTLCCDQPDHHRHPA